MKEKTVFAVSVKTKSIFKDGLSWANKENEPSQLIMQTCFLQIALHQELKERMVIKPEFTQLTKIFNSLLF